MLNWFLFLLSILVSVVRLEVVVVIMKVYERVSLEVDWNSRRL